MVCVGSQCTDGMDETLRLWVEVIQVNNDEQAFELDRGFFIRVDRDMCRLYCV